MADKETAFQKISELVSRFTEQYDSYKKSGYNETLTRRDFIDPFFKALGWDIDNEQGYAESYREVIHEDKVRVSGATKAPDYSFRIGGGNRLFFVEAKKPSVVIKDEILPAYQVRRYGWSAKLPISIVTDFEEFAIYDCTKKPNPADKPSVARIRYLTFTDYIEEFDFLWDTFSKEQVLKGSFDKFITGTTNKKGTTTVDKEFLLSLDAWRTYLATSISWNNKHLDEAEINYVVQQTIDRIIFLRIAEDRGVEPYGNLKDTVKQGELYKNLFEQFRRADEKYNSGLFDFKNDSISEHLKIDNKVIRTIITELYYPVSPYEFSVLSVEILGNAYEQFLGKVIRITPSHHAKIEEKPEVRKAGGIYYTPQYIVDYIVRNTVGKLVEDKKPGEVSNLKIVDPACGSGSFLIGAYQFLLDWHLNYYTAISSRTGQSAKGRRSDVLTPDGNLTTAEKKRILLNNIYGVDIDMNAVEVTKLSLLLKCLEGETSASVAHQLSMFQERVLPTLDNNIKCGNSLVDIHFYDGQPFETERTVKPFSWKRAFPEVFNIKRPDPDLELRYHIKKVENLQKETYALVDKYANKKIEEPVTSYGSMPGFDIVIGNPPYVRQELLGELKNYFESHYRVFHGMADLYSYFIEKGIGLLNRNGIMGIIVANKWMRSNYGEPLRKFLKEQTLHEIIDFGDLPVFESVTTYPCILIAGKPSNNLAFDVTQVNTLEFDSLQSYVRQHKILVRKTSLDDSGWNLADEKEQLLLKKIQNAGIPLGDYVNGKIYRGILTGLNEAFVIDATTRDRLIAEDERSAEIIKPFLAGRDIKRYQKPVSDKYLIFFPKGFTNLKGNHPRYPWKWMNINYPAIASYLQPFRAKAEKRYDKGDYWWELRACDYYDEFEKPKISWGNLCKEPQFSYISEPFYINAPSVIIPLEDKFLLGLMNSKLLWYFLLQIAPGRQGGFIEAKPMYVFKMPIIALDLKSILNIEIISLVDKLIDLNEEKRKANIISLTLHIQTKIDYCENRINEIVYQLYGLTEEEIWIVEGK